MQHDSCCQQPIIMMQTETLPGYFPLINTVILVECIHGHTRQTHLFHLKLFYRV